MPENLRVLDLQSLYSGRIGLTLSEGGHLAECAAICYHKCGTTISGELRVTGLHKEVFTLDCPIVTDQMRRTYKDIPEATEYGACGIAALIVEACAELTILARAPKDGGGFDYYLTSLSAGQAIDPENFFDSATARLEVSGILHGTESQIQTRLKQKIEQVERQPNLLPVYIVIVVFSSSVVRMEQR